MLSHVNTYGLGRVLYKKSNTPIGCLVINCHRLVEEKLLLIKDTFDTQKSMHQKFGQLAISLSLEAVASAWRGGKRLQ